MNALGHDPVHRDLDRFEREINFVEFAKAYGYTPIRRDSTPTTIVMSGPSTRRFEASADHEDIIVARLRRGTWIYSNVQHPIDSGTVVDFLRNGRHLDGPNGAERSFAEIRRELGDHRRFLQTLSDMKPIDMDRFQIARSFQSASRAESHEYLDDCRIHSTTYGDPKFAGTWRRDEQGNVLFPHRDENGITGYECRNTRTEAFSKQGSKALWVSVPSPHEKILVIAGTPLAAMSYHQLSAPAGTLFSKDLMRHATVGEGPMTPLQIELIEKALAKMPERSICVAAVGSHEHGHALWQQVAGLAPNHSHLRFMRDSPPHARDWNEVLRRDRPLQLQASRNRGP